MRGWDGEHAARGQAAATIAALALTSCTGPLPTIEEANDAVLLLRGYGAWAWALGIVLICADLVLPVSQTAIIAGLGIIYGVGLGGALGVIGLVASGLLGYGIMRTAAGRLVVRLIGDAAMRRTQTFFDDAGAWAIVLTRSLPYSMPEILVFLAGLARMRIGLFVLAMTVGSLPTGFMYAAIGAGWSEQPVLALLASYVLPIATLPFALYAMRAIGRRRAARRAVD